MARQARFSRRAGRCRTLGCGGRRSFPSSRIRHLRGRGNPGCRRLQRDGFVHRKIERDEAERPAAVRQHRDEGDGSASARWNVRVRAEFRRREFAERDIRNRHKHAGREADDVHIRLRHGTEIRADVLPDAGRGYRRVHEPHLAEPLHERGKKRCALVQPEDETGFQIQEGRVDASQGCQKRKTRRSTQQERVYQLVQCRPREYNIELVSQQRRSVERALTAGVADFFKEENMAGKRLAVVASFVMSAFALAFAKESKSDKFFTLVESPTTTARDIKKEISGMEGLTRGDDKETLLMAALKADRGVAVITAILESGVDADKKTKQKKTAVMYACQYSSDAEVVDKVICYGTLTKGARKKRILHGFVRVSEKEPERLLGRAHPCRSRKIRRCPEGFFRRKSRAGGGHSPKEGGTCSSPRSD